MEGKFGYCAHVTVKYKPIDHGGGRLSDRWLCESGCGTMFIPVACPAVAPAKDLADWYCLYCNVNVPWNQVTFQETHDPRCGGCGHTVKPTNDISNVKCPDCKGVGTHTGWESCPTCKGSGEVKPTNAVFNNPPTPTGDALRLAAQQLVWQIEAEGGHGFTVHGLVNKLKAALAALPESGRKDD